MIEELLRRRNLPTLPGFNEKSPAGWEERRQKITDLLARNVYGYLPTAAGETVWREVSKEITAAGKAVLRVMEITVPLAEGGSFSFPVNVTVPTFGGPDLKKPAFVFIAFGYPKYYPMEELVDEGVIIAEMVMNSVSPDLDDGFAQGLGGCLFSGAPRSGDGAGKISLWAFAASRVADYLLSLPCVDPKRLGVAGHSRLGKTALWAGANDTRFTHVFSNESGCAGAAITRGKTGETFRDIYDRFPYWFCPNMELTARRFSEDEAPAFDQHFLLAAVAPRKLYVSSAADDAWCDPVSEYLCCMAASDAWKAAGRDGFIHPDRLPEAGERFAEGDIGYHLRPGSHFHSRYDWVRFCDFIKS